MKDFSDHPREQIIEEVINELRREGFEIDEISAKLKEEKAPQDIERELQFV